MLQECEDLCDHALIVHDEGMAAVNHQKARHFRELRMRDRYLAVILAGYRWREAGIGAAVTGDDADLARYRPKLQRQAALPGPQLLAGRTGGEAEDRLVFQQVDDLAALIGRTEHDDTAKVVDRVILQVLPYQNAAE